MDMANNVNTEEVMTPEINEEPTVNVVGDVIGVVSGCKKLNIRKAETKNSEVVTVVPAGTELKIDPEYCNKSWCAIQTEDGVRGFCIKDFVTIGQ